MPRSIAQTVQIGILFALPTGLGSGCRTIPEEPRSFQRSYAEGTKLSRSAENDAISLAERMGVREIESITTSYVEPGHMPIIRVKERETVGDRSVTYRTIDMFWTKWKDSWDFESLAEETTAGGQILAEQPEKIERAILKGGGKEYRVSLEADVPHATAERILSGFLGGKIRLQNLRREVDYQRVKNFENPSSIRYDQATGRHVIAFSSPDGFRWSSYTVSLDGGEVVIHGVVTMTA